MYKAPRPAYDIAFDCNCPVHRGLPRSAYNAPGCRCLNSCASQPITVLAPQINGALFLRPRRRALVRARLAAGALGLALRNPRYRRPPTG